MSKRDDSRNYQAIECYNEYLEDMRCFKEWSERCGSTQEGNGFCDWNFNWNANRCLAKRAGIQFTAPRNGDCSAEIIERCFKEGQQGVQCLSDRIIEILTSVRYGILLNANNTPMQDALFSDLQGTCDVSNRDFFRRSDGSCNNPIIPGSGARGARILRHDYTFNQEQEMKIRNNSFPNAWNLAEKFMKRKNETKPKLHTTGVNMLAASWVNFFIHDFFGGTENPHDKILTKIKGGKCPFNNRPGHSDQYYEINRHKPKQDTGSDPSPINVPGRREFRNRVTSWFDASQIYGNTIEVANEQRTFVDGKLKVNVDGTMLSKIFFSREDDGFLKTNQVDPDAPPLFQSGDIDDRVNRWIGTTAFSHLWILEHNNIVTLLKQTTEGSSMNDEQLYQTARLIVSAEIVKVHLLEWTNQMVDDANVQQIQVLSWGRVGLPMTTTEQISTLGVSFDFLADYRWHSMINENIDVVDPETRVKTGERINVFDTLMNTTAHRQHGLKKVLASLASTPAHDITINNLAEGFFKINHPSFSNHYSPNRNSKCPNYPYLNLGVNDILRNRDHSVPNFNEQRRKVGLAPAQTFMDFDVTPEQALEMAKIYNWDVENVDFMVGMLAEKKASFEGFPTSVLASFIPFVFTRLRYDRFFTDHFNAQHYSQFGIDRLKPATGSGVTLAQIIQENLGYDVSPYQNKIFKVWN